ncbi:MAG: hypothetical protein AAGD32_15650 [Planctomycetota bacterium]
MIPRPINLRHRDGRQASISAEPADGGWIVRVGVGRNVDRLQTSKTVGPVDEGEVSEAFATLRAELAADGFQSGATTAALTDLSATPRDPRQRGLAATRLFYLADPIACEPLLAALKNANEEACAIIDALGTCGDEHAAEIVAEHAARKLLSRRRSGVEALINLGSHASLDGAVERLEEELAGPLLDPTKASEPARIAATLLEAEPKRRGQYADFLYEYAGLTNQPVIAEGVCNFLFQLGNGWHDPYVWRYTKSILKRAQLRRDADTLGRLATRIDVSRSSSQVANVKSGLTGEVGFTTVFRSTTRDYIRRRVWRHLRNLAEYDPAHYPRHAACVLGGYQPTDEALLTRRSDHWQWSPFFGRDPWNRAYLVGRILHGGDPSTLFSGMKWIDAATRSEVERRKAESAADRARREAEWRQRREALQAARRERPTGIFGRAINWLTGNNAPPLDPAVETPADPPSARPQETTAPRPADRPEAFPQLWDADPTAFAALLARSRIERFIAFGLAGIERHPNALQSAEADDIVAMLDSPNERVVSLAADELQRRLSTDAVDWPLVLRLAFDERDEARTVAHEVLRRRPDAWTDGPERVVGLLTGSQADTAVVAAEVLVAVLSEADDTVRRALADRLLLILHNPPPPLPMPVPDDDSADDIDEARTMMGTPDDPRLDAVASVLADALALEADQLLPDTTDVIALLDGPAASARVAAAVLEQRSDAVELLGLLGLLRLADHDVTSVRAVACNLLRAHPTLWQTDPAPLLDLAEGQWPDTREVIADLLLRQTDFATLGVDNFLALLDSTLEDVRTAAKSAVLEGLATIDRTDLAEKLAEHPARDMRSFALDMAIDALPAGADALHKLRPLLVTALLDVTPSRALKVRVFDAIAESGATSDDAARLAADILLPVARSVTADDADRALAALAAVKIARPDAFEQLAITQIGNHRLDGAA